MPITVEKFLAVLPREAPELQRLLEEHRADNDGALLLHVLLGDVARICVQAHERGDDDFLRRCLGYLDIALQEGDEYVENAICVSFVENIGPWDANMQSFIATWPTALREEAAYQAKGR